MLTPLQLHMNSLRAADRRKEEARLRELREQEAAKRNDQATRQVRWQSNYGSSSSYTPATDYTPSYTPPAADPSPSSDYSGGGGSYDGGGASGDY